MSQPSAVTRLTLLPTVPRDHDPGAKVRRYRLATVRPSRPEDPSDRYAHLRRTHD